MDVLKFAWGGRVPINKCSHGVYLPAGDQINLGCQQCNPDGLGGEREVVLPRTSDTDVNFVRHVQREVCSNCGNVRTYSSDACRVCFRPFPALDTSGRLQPTANERERGRCPKCGSVIHYETKRRSVWECADCGTKFPAVKRKA